MSRRARAELHGWSGGAAVAIASPSADMGVNAESATETSATIADIAFSPSELTAATGTSVIGTNEDWEPHTATVEDGNFDSDRLDQGASFEHTFDEPGTFEYFCSFHPGMMGSVVVT